MRGLKFNSHRAQAGLGLNFVFMQLKKQVSKTLPMLATLYIFEIGQFYYPLFFWNDYHILLAP
jgi:hypothetical protein